MHKKSLSILALSILVASILVSCSGGSPCSTLTILSITDGEVLVMKEGADDWVEAGVEMELKEEDRIKTGDNSSTEITFFDGSTMEMEAGTEIEIISLDIVCSTGVTTITLEQTIGTIIFRVTKVIDPASRYEIETPTAVVAVRGSAVQVYVVEDGTTWATNLEGDIRVVAQDVELQVLEGQQCIARPSQPPELIAAAHNLTVSSTAGGSVTAPDEGTFAYNTGTVVNLTAEAEEGYYFASWTGDVGSIADVYAAETDITMHDDYDITANFLQYVPTCGTGHTQGMVGYWRADGDASDSYDGYDGIGYGVNYTAGKAGQAFSFDGVDDYVDVGYHDFLNSENAFSYSVWIRLNNDITAGGTGESMIISLHNGPYLRFNLATGELMSVLFIGGTGQDLKTNKSAWDRDTWYHIGVTFNESDWKIYVNGDLDNERSGGIKNAVGDSYHMKIGRWHYLNQGYFNGLIDELAIFNRALESTEIRQHYTNGLNNESYCSMAT